MLPIEIEFDILVMTIMRKNSPIKICYFVTLIIELPVADNNTHYDCDKFNLVTLLSTLRYKTTNILTKNVKVRQVPILHRV